MATSLISAAVSALLDQIVIEGNTVRPLPKVTRDVYDEFNEILVRLRGRWKRGKGHVFPYDPTLALRAVRSAGVMPAKNPLAYFPTPQELAEAIVAALPDRPPLTMLEPSAGEGALVRAALGRWPDLVVTAVELDPLNIALLRTCGVDATEANFLEHDFGDHRFDLVVMNPPFTADGDKQAWVTHLRRAFDLLSEHGVLACVAPAGTWLHSSKKVFASLRAWLLELGASIEYHDAGSFKDSGTGVSTLTILVRRGLDIGEIDGARSRLSFDGPASAPIAEAPEPILDLPDAVAALHEAFQAAREAEDELMAMMAELGFAPPGWAPPVSRSSKELKPPTPEPPEPIPDAGPQRPVRSAGPAQGDLFSNW